MRISTNTHERRTDVTAPVLKLGSTMRTIDIDTTPDNDEIEHLRNLKAELETECDNPVYNPEYASGTNERLHKFMLKMIAQIGQYLEGKE